MNYKKAQRNQYIHPQIVWYGLIVFLILYTITREDPLKVVKDYWYIFLSVLVLPLVAYYLIRKCLD